MPGHTVTINLTINGSKSSEIDDPAGKKKSHGLIFTFSPDNYQPMQIKYEYEVLSGALRVATSADGQDDMIKFEAGFVGLKLIKEVYINSDLEAPVKVLSVHSSDPRIIPIQKKDVLEANSRDAMIDLIYDPSQHSQTPSRQVKTGEEIQADWQKSSWNLSDLHTDNLSKVISGALGTVTNEDVALYRGHQNAKLLQPIWINDDNDVIEEIRAVLTVETSVVDSIEIPVTATVVRPEILSESLMEFGAVQIGAQKSHDLELFNPFDETIFLNLFIGRNTVKMNEEIKRINEYKIYEQ